MSFTNFLETEILDHVFAGAAYTAPGTHYLALFTGAPGETGGGTEVSGGGYTRKAVAFTTSGATTSNNAAVEFPTATGNYGTCLLYTSPSPRDGLLSRMPSSA